MRRSFPFPARSNLRRHLARWQGYRHLRRFGAVLSVVVLCMSGPARAADDEADWQKVIALDAGPSVKPTTQAEAKAAAVGHLQTQELALRAYIAAHPGSSHSFEAQLRLARLLRIASDFRNSTAAAAESRKIMDDLAKGPLTPEQKGELEFSRLSSMMRSLRDPTPQQRSELQSAARRFAVEHPADRRSAPLLAEVATLYDLEPKAKRALLNEALILNQDDELKARISDDLKRLDLLGTPLTFHYDTPTGARMDLAASKGKVVVVIFFASWSPPSIQAVGAAAKVLAKFPKDAVRCAAVSLDNAPAAGAAVLREAGAAWLLGCDGKGWGGEIVRGFGINALPTVWLIDKQGRLRSLNGAQGMESQIRQLLAEK